MISCLLECMFSTCGLVVIGLFVGFYFLLESTRLKEIRLRYNILRERRQRHVKNAIKRLESQLTSDDNKEDITKLTLLEIKSRIENGKLKAVQVLKAFQSKALKLHEKYNCLVEPVFEAEADAIAVDEKKQGGLLAGIPVSLKDDIGIKNYVTTAGLAKLIGKGSFEDSALVKVLRKNGAVIFARTNIPQSECSAESSNPIYGTTRNPHDPNRSPGGSSSGEGSLVGGGGSLLGFGSDIGGSIRTPSHFCGICGFKPSSSRISRLGMPKFLEPVVIPATWGPMARDVDSLVLAMRALWDGSMTHFDPLSPPVKFQNELFEDKKPLKIGYFYDNKFFSPVPVVRRALDMAIEELKKQGHELVEWVPPDIELIDVMETKGVFPDGGDCILDLLEGDIVDDSIKLMVLGFKVPKFLRPLVPFLARTFMSKRHGELAAGLAGLGNIYNYMQFSGKLQAYQSKVTEEWQSDGLDALICPPLPYPALPIGNPEHTISGAGYMFLFNVLDYPAGVVRMTKQNAADIEALRNYKTNEEFKLQGEIKKMVSQGEGLPVGVMVATCRWEDEKCLRVMKAVEKAADFIVQ